MLMMNRPGKENLPKVYAVLWDNGMTFRHRAFMGDEASRFEKELQAIVGTPTYDQDFDALVARWAGILIQPWDGVMYPEERDEQGVVTAQAEPVPFTEETAAAFIADADARRMWMKPILDYLFPSRVQGGRTAAEPPKKEAPAEDFLSKPSPTTGNE